MRMDRNRCPLITLLIDIIAFTRLIIKTLRGNKMKKIALLLFGFAFPGIALATNSIMDDVNTSCGYDVFASTSCSGCHVSDFKLDTPEKIQYLVEGACSFCPEVPSCTATPPAPPTEADLLLAAQSTTRAYNEDLFTLFIQHLNDVDGDFAAVFPACPEIAPLSASKFSRSTGYLVRRVTTRTRNSRNIPDAWELEQLLKFEKNAANGDPRTTFEITKPDGSLMYPQEFETFDVVTEGKGQDRKYFFRYMRSLTMPPLTKIDPITGETVPNLPCLKCHGTQDVLAPGVIAATQFEYPFDLAMGYVAGDIRGAWTIKIPLAAKP